MDEEDECLAYAMLRNKFHLATQWQYLQLQHRLMVAFSDSRTPEIVQQLVKVFKTKKSDTTVFP